MVVCGFALLLLFLGWDRSSSTLILAPSQAITTIATIAILAVLTRESYSKHRESFAQIRLFCCRITTRTGSSSSTKRKEVIMLSPVGCGS